MNRKQITLLIFAITLVGIIAFVFWIFNRPIKLKTTRVNLPVQTIKYDDQSVLFFNQRSFVIYNIPKNQTKQLGSTDTLPAEISDIKLSNDKRYVLFKAREQFYDDTLGKILNKSGVSATNPRWWIYDIQKDTYNFIPAVLTSATFKSGEGNRVLALSSSSSRVGDENYSGSTPTNSTLLEYQVPEMKVVNSQILDYFTNVISSSDRVFLQNPSLKVYEYNPSSKQVTQVLSEATSLLPNGVSQFALSKTIGESNVLYTWKGVPNKGIQKLGTIPNEGVGVCWGKSNTTLYFPQGRNKIATRKDGAMHNQSYVVDGMDKNSRELTLSTCVNDSLFIVSDVAQNNFIASKEPVTAQTIPNTYKKTLSNNTIIEYFPGERAFLVSIDGSNTRQNRELVYKQLKTDGIDPNLFIIRFDEARSSNSSDIYRPESPALGD